MGMFDSYEKLRKQHAKVAKLCEGGKAELPPYPGSLAATYRALYPDYIDTPHMTPLREAFEAAKRERVRGCFSFPPRAGKTETVIAAIVDRLLLDPSTRICYVSYAANFSKKKSARIRSLAAKMGVPIDPTTRSKQDWATGVGEGGVWATSVGGQITGMGFDLIVVDDLIANWEDAHSPIVRDTTWDAFMSDILTRLEPGGSIILNGTRWHEDDPIGRAVAAGWPETNMAALNDAGNSYWPERWSREDLLTLQADLGGANGLAWSALYMGKPRSDAERIFREVHTAAEIPPGPRRVAIGVDFAYTVEKSSDNCAAVVLVETGGVMYVADVLCDRMNEAAFREKVAELAGVDGWDCHNVAASIAATEKPNVELLQREGLAAWGIPAIKSKKVRALPTAAAFNMGRIKVLSGRTWTDAFVREVVSFTGADRKDDQVDALVTAYDALWQAGPIDWDYLEQFKDLQAFTPGLH